MVRLRKLNLLVGQSFSVRQANLAEDNAPVCISAGNDHQFFILMVMPVLEAGVDAQRQNPSGACHGAPEAAAIRSDPTERDTGGSAVC